MRLYTFEHSNRRSIAVEHDGLLIDLPAACFALTGRALPPATPPLPGDMVAFLRAGPSALKIAGQIVRLVANRTPVPASNPFIFPLNEVRLCAPVPRPGKILCSGINYRSHLTENPGAKLPASPFFFAKLPSAVIGPQEDIVHPPETLQLDYEVELAIVIGKQMRRVPASAAAEHIAGFTILHDVSARDVQFTDNQITLGKNFDTFCPLGPCLVTPDEIGDVGALKLRSYVNGTLMQDGSTADWLFPLPALLSRLAEVMTLEPGDVVSTGTPAGVGAFRQPPRFLQPGDSVRLEIEPIGVLENRVVAQD